MSIELRHLRYAEAAARHGSFRKAADALGLKQSNLSRRIRNLEEDLGVRLFIRTNGGVQTTPAGRDFIHGVRRILDDVQAVIIAANAVRRGDAGQLTLGFYTSLSAGSLRATLIDYSHRFPLVEISTVEDRRKRLFAGLQSGTIDIAIVTGEPSSDGGVSMALWSERIMVALPEAHPLASRGVLYWTDLKRERFVLSSRDPGPEIQDILVAKLASPGELPDIVSHDVSPESLKSLVSAGLGISVICESCMGASQAGLVYRETRDSAGSTRIGYCAYWMESNENPALRNFIGLLEERCPPATNRRALRAAASQSRDQSP